MSVIAVIGIFVGLAGLFIARRSITNFIRSVRPKESIAIFGTKGAGKTTLIRYLQGKPLPEEHIRTFGAQRVGKIVYDLSGNETYFFRSREMYDVGGEHKNQWRAIIESQDPSGIIYIADTRVPTEEKGGLKDLYDIYYEARTHQVAEKLRLRVLLVLLNKCDLWGTTPETREQITQHYRNNVLSEPLDFFHMEFGNIQIQFGCSSLIHSEYAGYTNEVLRRFAMVLSSKE